MAAKRKDQWGIQSVEIAASLLKTLNEIGRAAPLKEIAQVAKMHPSKVHRYLVSLTRSELVEQDATTGRYGIGPMGIAIELTGLRNVDAVRCASGFLPALRDQIDDTVLLALWSQRGPVVIQLEDSARPVYMNIRVGSVLPLLRSATGRVFAAFLPEPQIRALIDTESKAAGSAAFYKPAAVPSFLAETRRRRLAHVTGDLVPGVNAIAAPVLDHKGRIAASIGAIGRAEDLNVAFDGAVAATLKRTADEISRRLGYDGSDDRIE